LIFETTFLTHEYDYASNYLICPKIPKFSRKKFEIATDEVGNPIKQDEKKGKLREFKKGDIFFNYGCLPVSQPMHCIINIVLAQIEIEEF